MNQSNDVLPMARTSTTTAADIYVNHSNQSNNNRNNNNNDIEDDEVFYTDVLGSTLGLDTVYLLVVVPLALVSLTLNALAFVAFVRVRFTSAHRFGARSRPPASHVRLLQAYTLSNALTCVFVMVSSLLVMAPRYVGGISFAIASYFVGLYKCSLLPFGLGWLYFVANTLHVCIGVERLVALRVLSTIATTMPSAAAAIGSPPSVAAATSSFIRQQWQRGGKRLNATVFVCVVVLVCALVSAPLLFVTRPHSPQELAAVRHNITSTSTMSTLSMSALQYCERVALVDTLAITSMVVRELLTYALQLLVNVLVVVSFRRLLVQRSHLLKDGSCDKSGGSGRCGRLMRRAHTKLTKMTVCMCTLTLACNASVFVCELLLVYAVGVKSENETTTTTSQRRRDLVADYWLLACSMLLNLGKHVVNFVFFCQFSGRFRRYASALVVRRARQLCALVVACRVCSCFSCCCWCCHKTAAAAATRRRRRRDNNTNNNKANIKSTNNVVNNHISILRIATPNISNNNNNSSNSIKKRGWAIGWRLADLACQWWRERHIASAVTADAIYAFRK